MKIVLAATLAFLGSFSINAIKNKDVRNDIRKINDEIIKISNDNNKLRNNIKNIEQIINKVDENNK